jgi:hypothetical protein
MGGTSLSVLRLDSVFPPPRHRGYNRGMNARLKKRRGPITLLCESRRFRWLVAAPLTVLFLAILIGVVRTEFRGLKTRLSQVSPGMTREQVEEIFGPPVLFLNSGQSGMGGVLVWVDQLWQVDVILDSDGRVIRTSSTRSYSALNRAVGRAPNVSL